MFVLSEYICILFHLFYIRRAILTQTNAKKGLIEKKNTPYDIDIRDITLIKLGTKISYKKKQKINSSLVNNILFEKFQINNT